MVPPVVTPDDLVRRERSRSVATPRGGIGSRDYRSKIGNAAHTATAPASIAQLSAEWPVPSAVMLATTAAISTAHFTVWSESGYAVPGPPVGSMWANSSTKSASRATASRSVAGAWWASAALIAS